MPAISYSGKRTAIKSITKTQGKGRLSDQLIDQMSVFSFAHFQKDMSAVHRKSLILLNEDRELYLCKGFKHGHLVFITSVPLC